MNIHALRENWTSTKGKLRQRFPDLTEEDLNLAEGGEAALLDRVARRTGLTREDVEFFLEIECGCVDLPVRSRAFDAPSAGAGSDSASGLASGRDPRTASVGEHPRHDPDAPLVPAKTPPTPPAESATRQPVEPQDEMAQEAERSTGMSGKSGGV